MYSTVVDRTVLASVSHNDTWKVCAVIGTLDDRYSCRCTRAPDNGGGDTVGVGDGDLCCVLDE